MVKKEKKPTDKLADKTALTKFLQGVFGDAEKRRLKRLWKRAREITKLEPNYEKMSDEELKEQTEVFRKKIDKALKVARAEQGINKTGKKRPPVDDKKILNDLLPNGFYHNLQSVRVVEVLEDMNLCQETIDGILTHSWGYKPKLRKHKLSNMRTKLLISITTLKIL